MDMTPVGSTKTVDLVVDNLTDGGSETILSNQAYDLGTFADPALWNGIYLRVSNNTLTGTSTDDPRISFVPEPSTFILNLLGLLALAARSRARPARQ